MGVRDTTSGDRDTNSTPAEIALLAYPKCQMSAVYGLTDVFRIASEQSAAIDSSTTIRVCHWSISDTDVVCTYDTNPELDHRVSYNIFPPSLVAPESMDSARALREWAMNHRDSGAILGALCAGVFVLAETGILNQRRATTHWAFADEFSKRFPAVLLDASQMVIDEQDVITAAGIMAWVDLGLSLVEALLGPTVMLRTSRFMIADAPRQHQLPYMSVAPTTSHHDDLVLATQHRIDHELARMPSVRHLAEAAAVHPRTLQRRFREATGVSITRYLQAQRVERATHALATTRQPFERIAHSLGYEDPSTLQKILRRETGLTPTDYRRKFGAPGIRKSM